MIAAQPTQRARGRRSVVATNLDAAGPQSPPELARGLAESAHPVVDDPHGHTVARPGNQRVAEVLAHGVVVNDVALEVDEAPGTGDRVEPRRIVLARVPQQTDVVARYERRARGPRKRPLCERPDLSDRFSLASVHSVRRRRASREVARPSSSVLTHQGGLTSPRRPATPSRTWRATRAGSVGAWPGTGRSVETARSRSDTAA